MSATIAGLCSDGAVGFMSPTIPVCELNFSGAVHAAHDSHLVPLGIRKGGRGHRLVSHVRVLPCALSNLTRSRSLGSVSKIGKRLKHLIDINRKQTGWMSMSLLPDRTGLLRESHSANCSCERSLVVNGETRIRASSSLQRVQKV
jgi:hypothetical protein